LVIILQLFDDIEMLSGPWYYSTVSPNLSAKAISLRLRVYFSRFLKKNDARY